MKAFTGNWIFDAVYREPRLSLSSLFAAIWQRVCRLAVLVEAVTLLPVATLLVLPVFLYQLLNHGFYATLFGSPRSFSDK